MLPSYEGIFAWLADAQHQRNPNHQQAVVVLMDGQKSLWLEAQRRFEGVNRVEILDLLHAMSYLREAAELVYPNHATGPGLNSVKRQRTVFAKQQAQRLLNGQVQTVIRSLCARTPTLNAAQRQKIDVIVGYFRNNASRMQYDQYLAAGYPIASGVIEGACRHVVCDRMERSGCAVSASIRIGKRL
jgi:hypothetical protein